MLHAMRTMLLALTLATSLLTACGGKSAPPAAVTPPPAVDACGGCPDGQTCDTCPGDPSCPTCDVCGPAVCVPS